MFRLAGEAAQRQRGQTLLALTQPTQALTGLNNLLGSNP
jgi:hypothetical protein